MKILQSKRILRIFWIVLAISLTHFSLSSYTKHPIGGSTEVMLAKDGQALHSVVVSGEASIRTREAAKELSKYLGQITGGSFEINEGDGTGGIAVGSYEDFPVLELGNQFDPEDLTRQDEYLLRTHDKGVYLVGATDLAAQHAVWGFLYQLGYRQFFPTDKWEFIPENADLSINLDAFEKPDFYNRSAPRIAPWSDAQLWDRWHDRNRMTSSFIVNTGHSYDGIISRNQAEFNKHPEFLALVNGVRGGGRGDKFCISNEDLRHLVIKDAKRRVEENWESMSISMDPSDGSDWCECEPCAEMGSVSDRVVILANEVAEAINHMDHGEKYVGIYAYADHSPPPQVEVHSKVIVSIATAFIRGGYTLEELIEGWSGRTEMIGIREYHDVFQWSKGLPRKAIGGNVNYLVEKIPYYYNQGTRFLNSESTDSWAPNGLGFYLSALMLWNVDTAGYVDELVNDFVEKSFDEAYEPMSNFYNVIARDYDTPRSKEDLLAHMYGYIEEAYTLTEDSAVLARLDDLALYTRYVELWFRIESSEGQDARDKAAQDAYRHAYRMQNTMMVHIQALYRYLQRIGIEMPNEADPGNLSVGRELEDIEPWKSSKLFTDDEIAQFIADGLATYKKDKMEFEPVSFSEDLVPAAEMLDLPEVVTGDMGRDNTFRGGHKMFTWFRSADIKQLPLEVTGGLIAHYRDRGNVRFKLFSPQEVTLDPVDTDENVPPDGETYQIVLTSPYEGLHQLEWDDGNDLTMVKWTEGFHMTVRSSINDPASLRDNRQLYFYVPKGTETVGGYTSGTNNERTQVHDGAGNQVFVLEEVEGDEGFFSIPVPEGQDGKLWSFRRGYGNQILMTVPPYLARNEKELLLPKEVVEADRITSIENKLFNKRGTITIYPNPATETLYIQMENINEEMKGIRIYNSVGTRVKTLHTGKNDSEIESVDVTSFSPGLYFVKVEFKNIFITKKIMIE